MRYSREFWRAALRAAAFQNLPVKILQQHYPSRSVHARDTMAVMTSLKMLSTLPLAVAVMLLAAPAVVSQDQEIRLSVIVDKSCLIQPESDPLVLGDHVEAFRDEAICHLESVLSSHHIEEKITEGARSRFLVRVAEQEYVVQNPTDKPAVFIVRHDVPEHWKVDSDPQPSSMDGSTAVFLLNADPGQRVRLHVGMHRNYTVHQN